MSLRAFSIIVVPLACLALPGHASATSHDQANALRYVAPIECPPEAAFRQRFSSHLGVASDGRGTPSAAGVEVLIAPSVAGFSARLTVVTPEQTVTRQLSDAHCDALLDALALIAAIAADPAHRDVTTSHRPKPSLSKPVLAGIRVVPPTLWTLGVAYGLSSDAAPVVLRTLGVYLNHRRNDFGLVGHYFASLAFGQTEWLRYQLGEARFSWFTGRLAGCPLGSSVDRFSYGVCALTEIGWLEGRGASSIGPMSAGGAWLAPGIGLTTSLVIKPFELSWFGGVVTPILRDRYFFAPGEAVFTPKGVGLVAELRLGWVIR